MVSRCLSLFPGASCRRTKAGVRVHTLLDHDGYLPAVVSISPARQHEVKKARSLTLPQGSIVVEDLGNTDYARYTELSRQQVFFVTRQKRNAVYKVLGSRKVNKKQGPIAVQTSRLTGAKAWECPLPFRRSVYQDPETGTRLVFLANHFRLAAKTIADVYKDRWQIESFFRFLKQNLKVKAFIGNSDNAIMTQIYVALIAYLLLCYIKFLCSISVSLQTFMRILPLNLFRTCKIQEFFEPPDLNKVNILISEQLSLALA